MKTYLFLIACMVASAQSSTTSSWGGVQVATKEGVITDLRQSINGREVPLQQVEQKVLSKSGNTTVTEQIVRHYGPSGQVVSTERIVTEATLSPNGDSSVKSTTYRSDISGNMAPAERKAVETHNSGATTVVETQVEKPSVNGSFDVAEKRTLNSQKTADGKKEDETVYLRDTNGRLYTAQRSATVETKKGNETVANTAVYEPGMNGEMSLAQQKVAKTTVKADGSSTKEVELFGRASDSRAREAGAGPQITEKRVFETVKNTDGSVVQRESVQVPSVNDPGHLMAPRTVSETVCRGECGKP